jgi:hypothetical protein
MIMTSDANVTPGDLASGGITAEQIERKAFMTSAGGMIYVFSRTGADALVDALFDDRRDVHITMYDAVKDDMMPLIEEFGRHTNANMQITLSDSQPPVAFGPGIDVILTVSTLHSGCGTKQITPSVHAYFVNGTGGMAGSFIEWLPDIRSGIHIMFSSGVSDVIAPLINEFEGIAGTSVQISSVALGSPMSFADGVNILMTLDPTMISAEVPPAEMKEKAYVAENGTIVYIFIKKGTEELTDALIDHLMAQKRILKIVFANSTKDDVEQVTEEFAGYTNVTYVLDQVTGHPEVEFTDGIDIVIRGHSVSYTEHGCMVMDNNVYVYYKHDSQGMAKLFIDWFRKNKAD